MQKIFQLLLIISVACLAGCSVFSIYRPNVEQGNVYKPEQVQQLQIGMSKGEVKYILGSPVLQNTFDKNRWNYVYTMQKQGKIVETKRLVLYFKNGRLQNVEQA